MRPSCCCGPLRRGGNRRLPSLLQCASRVAISVRSASSQSSASPTTPAVGRVEWAARRWVQRRVNPNVNSLELSNAQFAFDLLRVAHRLDARDAQAQSSRSVVIDPTAVALMLQQNSQARRLLLDAADGEMSEQQLQRHLHSIPHQRIQRELRAACSPFAQWSSPGIGGSGSSSFTGFLAPRFAVTKTASPSWFIPTATSLQAATFQPPRRSSTAAALTAEETQVTALERSLRLPALMLYRTGRLWYVEDRCSQTADVPYLHPDFSLTVIAPRFTQQPTIAQHPSPLYLALQRQRSDIHSVIGALQADALVQQLHRHAALLPGLLVMPTFTASYSLSASISAAAADGSARGGGGREEAEAGDRCELSLSSAGLSTGGLKSSASRRPQSEFLLSAHRPFVLLVRHRPTNAVAIIAKVEQPLRDDRLYPYPQRRVQWLEDHTPIPQFEQP